MPTYEFLCKNCEKKFTVMTSISQRNQVECPYCSSSDLQQVFGNSFFFMGNKNKGGCQSTPPWGGFS
ncbi:MAG: zinc ribbon domain-containing protein [Firmicutes bacterium]|nr:zinc ribbon domain-containing protein [Bacillota bacterium]